METADLVRTRRALHAVAEFVLAGPQYAASGTIRLKVTPGGFGTCAAPDLRVEGTDLVVGRARFPLTATCAELAAAVDVEARDLRDVYADGPDHPLDDPVSVDPEAVAVIAEAFGRGDAALRALAPDEDPVLWPEHFDLGITLDEVNFGVSPGDGHLDVPYAYVGPWTPREGDFWNEAFGAARPLTELPDVTTLIQFFEQGAAHAASDPARPA